VREILNSSKRNPQGFSGAFIHRIDFIAELYGFVGTNRKYSRLYA